MKYCKDQYVVYNGLQICRFGEVVKKSFDGTVEKEYCTLFPTDVKSTYYVPSDKIDETIRPILTKEQLLELIDRFPYAKSEWPGNRSNLKCVFWSALKKGDYNSIIPLLNGIYHEKSNREGRGKQLLNEDKRNFETVIRLLHSEIAFSFGIGIDETETFISNRIKEHCHN